MSTLTIVALDPGGTTGWAYFRATKLLNTEDQAEYYDESWSCGQLGPGKHHKQLYDMLGLQHTDEYHIVCESFEYRNKTRPGLELVSREYIGVTELFCQERNVPLHMQSASMGKGFVRDTNIKRLGLWSVGWKHAMDSYRHLLCYMINAAHVMEYDLLERGWK